MIRRPIGLQEMPLRRGTFNEFGEFIREMLRNALDYLQDLPLLAFWPGLFILIAVVCFNFFGDGLRDALDPHHVNRKE